MNLFLNLFFFFQVTVTPLNETSEFSSDRLQTAASAHPVDEKGLDELDNLQCDQETDGDQVVEQDDEGEEVEAKVSCPAICQGTNLGQKGSNTQETHKCWSTNLS